MLTVWASAWNFVALESGAQPFSLYEPQSVGHLFYPSVWVTLKEKQINDWPNKDSHYPPTFLHRLTNCNWAQSSAFLVITYCSISQHAEKVMCNNPCLRALRPGRACVIYHQTSWLPFCPLLARQAIDSSAHSDYSCTEYSCNQLPHRYACKTFWGTSENDI